MSMPLSFFTQRTMVLLAILFVLEVGSTFFLEVPGQGSEPTIQKISEIDGPRIDEVAAMVVASETSDAALSERPLPPGIFIFLFLAYVSLLVFNFSFTFDRVTSPQWFWELCYTGCALLGWYVLDPSREALWFPLLILKVGLIVFLWYTFLLEKRAITFEKGE